jgi:hypothetical protein
MAKNPPTTTDKPATAPSITNPELAQQIANVTGLGAGWIFERLNDADAWDVAAELLAMGAVDEIAAIINPSNKAI